MCYMSLVLTEVSHFGVAIAADSAVTFPSGRVFVGLQKLLPVYKINAGLAFWGGGEVGEIDTDVWIQNFIDNEVEDGMRLWDMANKLAEKLNESFGRVISDRMGIHVGGYDSENGVRGPAFYHVHNGHYHVVFGNGQVREIPDENPPIREFRAHKDRPPRLYNVNDEPPMTRNGDFGIFSVLMENLLPLFRNLHQMAGFEFPQVRDLATRGEYLRFLVNLIKEMYRLSNYRIRMVPEPSMGGDAFVGGPVTVLTISDSGIESFYSS